MDAEKLLKQINNVIRRCQNTPFYLGRLNQGPLKSMADFQRLPLTTKADLGNNSPSGMLCVPPVKLYQYHESDANTGKPVRVWLTKKDFQIGAKALALSGVCFEPDDVALVRFPYSIHEFAHTFTAAAQMRGACVVPAGAHSKVSPFPRVVNLLRKLKVTILACLPLQALLIAETAELMGLEPGMDFPDLRAVCTAGETLAPGRRQTLEKIWGVPVFDHYSPAETGTAGVACRYQQLHPLEDYVHLEILREDLKTPAEPGETGYLVITTLKRRGMPLIRYLPGELARLVPVRCPCGARISLEIRGPVESMIRLAGRRLDLWEIEEIISRLPCRRFWAVAPKVGQLEIITEAERTSEKISPDELAVTCKSLEQAFGVKLSVTIAPKGTLYSREELLSTGLVGKPQYIYTAPEMVEQKYLQSARI